MQTALRKIEARDDTLQAVSHVAPGAADRAARNDLRRAQTGLRGPLDGMPTLFKGNMGTTEEGVPTTAGISALSDSFAPLEATLVARARAAGMENLGQTNMTGASGFQNLLPGQSAHGQTVNAVDQSLSGSGSSTGAAAAVRAGYVPGSWGVETDGSIVMPAAANGVVGFKPSKGVTSTAGMVPGALHFDSPGPLARDVWTAAQMVRAVAGPDPKDLATLAAPLRNVDYVANLRLTSLKGQRLGVMGGQFTGFESGTDKVFGRALALLERGGAELISDVRVELPEEFFALEQSVRLHEFKAGLEAYLAKLTPPNSPRSLREIIQHARARGESGLEWMERADGLENLDSPTYRDARRTCLRILRELGAEAALKRHGVSALIAPTRAPAEPLYLPPGAKRETHGAFSSLAAMAGLPMLSVPMGEVGGRPVGLAFIGGRYQDSALLGYGFAFEQLRRARSLERP